MLRRLYEVGPWSRRLQQSVSSVMFTDEFTLLSLSWEAIHNWQAHIGAVPNAEGKSKVFDLLKAFPQRDVSVDLVVTTSPAAVGTFARRQGDVCTPDAALGSASW